LERYFFLFVYFKIHFYLFWIFIINFVLFLQKIKSFFSQLTELIVELIVVIVNYFDLWKDLGPLQLINLVGKIVNGRNILSSKLQFSNYLPFDQYLQGNITYWFFIGKSALDFLKFEFSFAIFHIFFYRFNSIYYIGNL